MKPRNGAILALLFVATCSETEPDRSSTSIKSSTKALGKIAASESATWTKVGSSTLPDGRYLQAMAFDETRKVAVMFGGLLYNLSSGVTLPNQETWEWNPETGEWTNRTLPGPLPDARSGAAMVFDPERNKVVLFGGRAGSGFNYEDTWEWDPTSGTWTDVSNSGTRPSGRSQHAMVFEKSTGKVLLFGGGRSDSSSSDGTGISVSFGDTWEWDAPTHTWSARQTNTSPTARYALGLVWDGARKKAVLFGGMQKDSAGVDGFPKQDTWEWEPTDSSWTERTTQGNKPSPRYAHSMAFAGGINKAIVFGGWDIATGASKNDAWEWDSTSGAWTQRLTGSESSIPSARMYASLVADDSRAALELIAGQVTTNSYGNGGIGTGGMYGPMPTMPYYTTIDGSREIWEISPVSYACKDRSAPSHTPLPRSNHALAYNPATGKTYLFGGVDAMQQSFDDLWEWDGKIWTQVLTDTRPSARLDAALAYDPARKSLILYGGQTNQSSGVYYQAVLGDTWEWNSTTRKWTQLFPTTSPDPLYSHGMVTDTTRNKILLFAGASNNYPYYLPGIPIMPPIPIGGSYKNPIRNEVWEWDGIKTTWTNRTPVVASTAPNPRQYPVLAYDESRQKLFVQDSSTYSYMGTGSNSAFWEWDPTSAGWALRDSGDYLDYGTPYYAAYDTSRRRAAIFGDLWNPMTGFNETWELDAKGPTWYVRTLANTPFSTLNSAITYDRGRGVIVLFGGNANGSLTDETWEYNVAGLGNGEGCSASTASTCASSNCVDGVCCESLSCTGPCQSCSVSGHEGTCVAAQAGTEVAGSCSSGQACDGNGACKASNGKACILATDCGSGFCVDGVCCNGACKGTCTSCNQPGLAGKCSPYAMGTDPEKECSKTPGTCVSACDGVGSCTYPQYGVSCGSCLVCDGIGNCSQRDPSCGYGTGGYYGGYGGSYISTGGYYGGYGGSYNSTGGFYGGTGGRYLTGGTFGGYGGYYTTGGFYGSTGGAYAGTGGRYSTGGNYGTTGGYFGSSGGTLAGTGGRSSTGGFYGSTGGFYGSTGGFYGSTGGFYGSTGGMFAGTGGSNGSGGRQGTDGGWVNPDGQQDPNAVTSAQLHRSGCYCELASTAPAKPGMAAPILLAGAALFLRRRRQPRQ